MPKSLAVLLFLCAAIASAQKSAPPDLGYDPTANFAGLKSYAWFEDPKWVMPEGNAVVDGPFIDRTVRAAVNAKLGKKGFTKVETGASFFVTYYASEAGGLNQNKWERPREDGGFLLWPLTQPETNPAFVDDSGTKYRHRSILVLEVRDSRQKLIWRRARTASTGTNPDAVAKGIDRAAGKLLAHFPPGNGTEKK